VLLLLVDLDPEKKVAKGRVIPASCVGLDLARFNAGFVIDDGKYGIQVVLYSDVIYVYC